MHLDVHKSYPEGRPVNEASTADVKIFPAGLDGNDSRRIWQGLAGPRERKDPSGVRSQNLPKRILGYELSLTP